MSNVWEEIGDIEPDLVIPSDVIRELFKPLKSVTGDKIDFRIQQVTFFPEEVKYTTTASAFSQVLSTTAFEQTKEVPHPTFGYDPAASKAKESFRYRLLLFPTKRMEFEPECVNKSETRKWKELLRIQRQKWECHRKLAGVGKYSLK